MVKSVHSQVAKLTGHQYLVVKVDVTIKKLRYKMWLEWFPCHALLNYPFVSVLSRIDIIGGVLSLLSHH